MRPGSVSPAGWVGTPPVAAEANVRKLQQGAEKSQSAPQDAGREAAPAAGAGAQDLDKRLEQALEAVNKAVRVFDRRIRFERHEGTGRILFRVIDAETDQVVREIPPERLLDAVAHMLEVLGLLVDERA